MYYTIVASQLLESLIMNEPIHSKLYTTEASKSKEKVVNELKVPDPPLDVAKAVLEEEEENRLQ